MSDETGAGLARVRDAFEAIANSIYDVIAAGDKLARQRADAANDASAARAKAQHDSFYGDPATQTQTWVSQTDLSQGAAAQLNSGGGKGGAGAGNTAVEGAQGFDPLDPALLTAEGYGVGAYKAGGQSVSAFVNSIAAKFDSYAQKLQSEFGAGNYMAKVFSTLAQYIREGRFGGDTAEQYAQGILANFAPGAENELVDPTSSPTAKALVAEFLRFLSGGSLI